jgi:hypothetical protein
MREVARLVIARDPLARRLGPAERRRRLMQDLRDVGERIAACPPSATALPAVPVSLDQDAIEDLLSAIWRAEQSLDAACGPAKALDRALEIVARQHGSDG